MWELLIYTLIVFGITTFIFCLIREFRRAVVSAFPPTSLPQPARKSSPRRGGKRKTKEQLITLPQPPPLITEVDVDVPFQRRRPLSILVSLFFGLLFVAVGIFILGYAIQLARQDQALQAWPTAQGRIISSAIKENKDAENNSLYDTDIRYSYKVNSTTYAGRQVSFVDLSSANKSSVQSILARYPAGNSVLVHYNPAQPANAVLETGSNTNTLPLYAVGGAFALASTFFFFLASKKKLTSRPRFKYVK